MSQFSDPNAQKWWDSYEQRLPAIAPVSQPASYLEDVAMSPVRGVVGVGYGAYSLADMLTFDTLPDASPNFGLGNSESMTGAVVENLTGFLLPFGVINKGVAGAGRAAGYLGKFGKVETAANLLREESALARAAGDLAGAASSARKAALITTAAEAVQTGVAGALTQALFFPGTGGNLSSLIESSPELSNPITSFLATDEDTPEVIGRLKNAIEGFFVGGVVDSVIGAVRIAKAGSKAAALGKDADAAMLAEKVKIKRERIQQIQSAVQVDDKQASVLDAWIESTGVPREKIVFKAADGSEAQTGAKAFVDFTSDGQAVVSFLEGANFESAVHEHGHVIRRWTFNRDIPSEYRGGITDGDIRIIEDAVGVKDGKWTTADEEKFVSLMADWMKDGKADSYETAAVLRAASQHLSNIAFNSGIEISPSVRSVLEKGIARSAAKIEGAPGANGRLYQIDLNAKPPDAAINIPRVSSSDEAKTVVAVSIETEMGKAATAFDSLDTHTLEMEAMSALRDNGLLDPSTMDQFAVAIKNLSRGDLQSLAVRQHASRILQDSYARDLASRLAKIEAKTATDQELVEFHQLTQRFYAVTKANKEFSVAGAQMLGFRRVIPTASSASKILAEEAVSDPSIAGGLIAAAGGRDSIIAQAQLIKAALNSTEYLPDAVGRVNQIISGAKTGKLNLVLEYWMNSLLSGPTTFAANASSNLFTMLYAPAEAALGSAMLADFNGVKSALSRYIGLFKGAGDSLSAVKAFWKGESAGLLPDSHSFSTLTDAANSRAISAAGVGLSEDSMTGMAVNWIGKFINIPSKLLKTTDELFKQLNYRSTLYGKLNGDALDLVKSGILHPTQVGEWVESQMKRAATRSQAYSEAVVKNEAYKAARQQIDAGAFQSGSREHKAFVAKYLQDNWDSGLAETSKQATQAAQEATFSAPLQASRGGFEGASARLASFLNETPVLRFFVPFVTVPTRIALYAGQRLPVNALFAGADRLSGGNMPTVRKFALRLSEEISSSDKAIRGEALGRMAMGTTISTSVFLSAWNGTLTGGGPKDPETRNALMASGWQPYSIKIGDQYISYRRVEPFATLMGLAADIVEAYRFADETNRPVLDATVSGIVGSITNNISNKTYLQGVVNLANAITAPQRYGGNFAQTFISSFVPSLLAQSKSIVFGDSELREVRTILDAVRNRIPILAEGLDPRRNVLGEPIRGPEYFLDGLFSVAGLTTPFGISKDQKDPVKAEMARLSYGFSNPKPVQSGVDLSSIRINDKQSAYDRWMELTGEVRLGGRTLHQSLTKIVNSASYKKLAESGDFQEGYESPRIPIIRNEIVRYRDAAWRQMIRNHPELKQAERDFRERNAALRAGKSIAAIRALGANS